MGFKPFPKPPAPKLPLHRCGVCERNLYWWCFSETELAHHDVPFCRDCSSITIAELLFDWVLVAHSLLDEVLGRA